MGREIRRVPADWQHPTQSCPHSPWNGGCEEAKRNNGRCFHPLFNKSFLEAAREWLDAAIRWDNDEDPDTAEHKKDHPFYWQWNGKPPDPKYYRPDWKSAPTYYQVYETVSEGTPVTPHFATKEELIDYLVESGDFWDQIRGTGGWDRKAAEEFVSREWAPTMVMIPEAGIMLKPRDGGL